MAPHRENWLPNTKTYWIYFGLYRQTIYMCVCVCIYIHIYLLLLLSSPVMSNSLRLHGLQHTRLPCPSPSPGIYPSFQVHCTEDAIQPSHPASLHVCVLSCLAMSVSLWPHGLSGRKLPGSPVHRHEYLEWGAIPSPGIFPTQRSNPDLLYCRWILHHLSHQGSHVYTYIYTHIYTYMCVHIYIHIHRHIYTYLEVCIREGNGTPLQYSCLENPMDGGAW